MSVSKTPPSAPLPQVVGDKEYTVQDAVILDLPPSNKFNFAWPPGNAGQPTSTATLAQGSETPTDTSEAKLSSGSKADQVEDTNVTPTNPPKSQLLGPPNYPRLSRALTMPETSQLGYLRNPHRPDPPKLSQSDPVSHQSSQFHELSLELADSVQTIVQTMLQISPPQVLDAAKEQFSACSLSVPTSSMSAMFTTMKNLNYISANMAFFCPEPSNVSTPDEVDFRRPPWITYDNHSDFDIGESLQSVGDTLSGAAAHAGVDLVLFHGDVGMKHVFVKGDENGISFTLSHVIRQVIGTSQPGDSIELGLFVVSIEPHRREAESSVPDDDSRNSRSPAEFDGPVRCTVEISHRFGPSDSSLVEGELSIPRMTQSRPSPSFSTLLLRRLLNRIGASLVADLVPKNFAVGRTCELTLILERGTSPTTILGDASCDDPIASEPTLAQLTSFADSLKGKKVTLYASSKGSFAHHITSYLTAWGMDVSHISSEGGVEGSGNQPESASSSASSLESRPPTNNSSLSMYASSSEDFVSSGIPPKSEAPHTGSQPLSFIFIDDDVEVLKQRLEALRVEQPYPLNLSLRRRPPLATHHRPRSSPQIARSPGQAASVPSASSVVIVHFTSLSNYKSIKEVIQSVLASYSGSSARIPEVMIIPKPAGPRRFLTALHTAVTKPIIDPFFDPIATSPTSPGSQTGSSFFNSFDGTSSTSKTSAVSQRLAESRTNSDRSTRSSKDMDHASQSQPSPLGATDRMEYFSAETVKLGTSPSSGLMIQSPDGQPAGIFFHPRAKTQRIPSSGLTMERDQGQLFIPDRRASVSRLTSSSERDDVTFSSLHERGGGADTAAVQEGSSTPRSKGRKQTSPRMEEFASLEAPPRGPSTPEIPGHSTVPGPPSTDANTSVPTRRAMTRRSTLEKKVSSPSPAASRKGKAPADGNIVPPINVLIVDDNPINQTILSTFMKKKKIRYDVAKNGQEAVQKWRTGGFHLILMDIQMPIMDGIEATKEIRRLEKSNPSAGFPPASPSLEDQRTPSVGSTSDLSAEVKQPSLHRSSVIIVALTASSLQSDRVAALGAGCNDFLTKPVSLLWLNNKIIEWGSIKALQMWADLRPDVARTISTGQAAQARNVAERLHVPKSRKSPSPSRSSTMPNEASSGKDEIVDILVPPPDSAALFSTTSSAFWSPAQPSPQTFWGALGIPSPAGNHSSRLSSTQTSPIANSSFSSLHPWQQLPIHLRKEADETPMHHGSGNADQPPTLSQQLSGETARSSEQPQVSTRQVVAQPPR